MRTLTPLRSIAGLALLAAPVFAVTKPAPTTPKSAEAAPAAAAKDVGPAQSLQGTVWTIDFTHKEVTVKDKSGVPFDFTVEPSTRIKSGDKTLQFGDLLSADHVTIQFVPEEKGDIAESIQVGSKS